jgi:hypothetical protein
MKLFGAIELHSMRKTCPFKNFLLKPSTGRSEKSEQHWTRHENYNYMDVLLIIRSRSLLLFRVGFSRSRLILCKPAPMAKFRGASEQRPTSKNYFAARRNQLPESPSALQMPRMASRAAVANSSPMEVSRAWGKSAVQLPVNSRFWLSRVARQVPLHPVENFCADHVPRKTIISKPSPSVQVPDALSTEEAGSTVQLPSKVRPAVVRTLQVERCDSSLKVALSCAPPDVSAARTQPIKPRAVLTMYQVCWPTASARGISVSPFCNVAISSDSTSCWE